MKFKQITLVNFMRYKGEISLSFSTDESKNVTAILGDNTFGKTTIAQAFRWGLYGDVTSTQYDTKEKVTLLNREVISELPDVNKKAEIRVEITVIDNDGSDEIEYKFIRSQYFSKKRPDSNCHEVHSTVPAKLVVHQSKNGKPTEKSVIDNDYNKERKGYVQEIINNMFPEKLSSYLFFDGERWGNKQNKSEDIKKAINTILGISSIIKIMEHLKDGNNECKTPAYKKLSSCIKGSSSESQELKRKISDYEKQISSCERDLMNYDQDISVAEKDMKDLEEFLNSHKSTEEDQKEIKALTDRIESNTRKQNSCFKGFIKEFSKADKILASLLLANVEDILLTVNLEGKDIPDITSDTIDYLISAGRCLCGEELVDGDKHYQEMMALREEVYPNKIGGPARNLKEKLSEWKYESEDFKTSMYDKATEYTDFQQIIDNDMRQKEKIEARIDRTYNLEDTRKRYNRAKNDYQTASKKKGETEGKINTYQKNISSLQAQLKMLEQQNEINKPYYLAMEYAEKIYDIAASLVREREKPTVEELNELIKINFEKMFDSKEKYARLEKDYKIHMYYKNIGGLSDREETQLSAGEQIAINFVYIVSILELAKRRKEKDVRDSGILRLPLVLDAPFSNLSGENTFLVANKLPEFAEQVIIFMLDKDWNASGLKSYALPEYCYHITRDKADNNSTISVDGEDNL